MAIEPTFFFYDLETSGFDPRRARIMQFAGQRTSLDLRAIGDPINELISLTPDVLPDPDAILVTGITPQQTQAEGLTEAEFLKVFYEEAVKPGTIFVGFNSVRFDDEFMRFFNYRNFYDAYEWEWKDECSRWDILDVVRMTRALRPDGIEWPFAPDGKPANRLEFLTKVNKLSHADAHDALSDVLATIEVAKLIRSKQPELFDYLLSVRGKKEVAKLVDASQPFVYTSGRYPGEIAHTTVAIKLVANPTSDGALVYDLRHDPAPFLKMSIDELVKAWKFTKDPEVLRLPVKTLKYNRCPAVAPLGVIKDKASQERIGLELETVQKHLEILKGQHAEFTKNILGAVSQMDAAREAEQASLIADVANVDGQLYDGGFVGPADKLVMQKVVSAQPESLSELAKGLKDQRLQQLLPLYKARNYPKSLTPDERAAWDEFCHQQLFGGGKDSRAQRYFTRIEELSGGKLTRREQFLLEELRLYGESIVPADAVG
ncbi:MAG TPA: exodeoxyribonuclease I [Candidatus Saccharimonadales bacterium]|nr:exodeoxyribonuclease I [Candidatus Saccharimonadales bacterium]